jgi:hypothetical protein
MLLKFAENFDGLNYNDLVLAAIEHMERTEVLEAVTD